jgi:site-specific DNA recombinase
MNTERAVIYARVSDDAQRENYSVPTQIAESQVYAEGRGYALVGDRYVDRETGLDTALRDNAVLAFVDDYTSTVIVRPMFEKALRYLEREGFDVLIVHALDRLARDPYIRRTLEIQVESQGARVEYVLGNYDDTPEGEVRKDLDATFAKWENAKRVERCLRGKRGKAQRGLFVGGRTPYAYDIDPDAKGGLAVNRIQAKIVQRIFNLFVHERLSTRRIAVLLTEEGVPSPTGGSKWGKSTVARILKNTTYIGQCFYNKNKRKGTRFETRDQDDWIAIETTPIIDRAVFEGAQRILDEHRRVLRRSPRRFYLLSGMVLCEECGRPYIANAQRAGRNGRATDGQSYRHRLKHGHCRNHQISARILEQVVWDEIVKVLLEPENLRRGYEQSLEIEQAKHARHLAHMETLRQAAAKLDERQQNLNTAYTDPDINLTKDEYLAQRVQIEDSRKQLKSEVEALEKELASIPTQVEFETLEAFSAEIRESLSHELNLTPEEKRRVLEMLHVKVFLRADGAIRIQGWFAVSSEGLLTTSSKHCERQPLPLPVPV